MYDELIKRLRKCASYDPRFVIQDCEDAADAIEELEKQLDEETEYATALACNVPRWIPVTEQLPDSFGHYFAFIISGEFEQVSWGTIAYFDGKIFRWEHKGQEDLEKATHWMPLPQPPEDSES